MNTSDERCKSCEHWSRQLPEDASEDKYWELPEDKQDLPYKQRACLVVVDGASSSVIKEAPTEAALTRLPDDATFVNVYEAYSNELMTGPMFGCIHWEKDTRPRNEA